MVLQVNLQLKLDIDLNNHPKVELETIQSQICTTVLSKERPNLHAFPRNCFMDNTQLSASLTRPLPVYQYIGTEPEIKVIRT